MSQHCNCWCGVSLLERSLSSTVACTATNVVQEAHVASVGVDVWRGLVAAERHAARSMMILDWMVARSDSCEVLLMDEL